MVARSHIFRVLAGVALLLQLALPFAQAQAAANGTDLGSLICNPSGRAISTEAKAALKDLLTAVGEDISEDGQTDRSPDCERCVTPNFAITALNATMPAPTTYHRTASQRPQRDAVGSITVRGPPCGTRAPPTFV